MSYLYIDVIHHGSLVELRPTVATAREWLLEHLPLDCRWGPEANPSFLIGASLYHVVLGGLAEAMEDDGT